MCTMEKITPGLTGDETRIPTFRGLATGPGKSGGLSGVGLGLVVNRIPDLDRGLGGGYQIFLSVVVRRT